MADPLDVPLEDPDIREEVELVAALMVAAGQSDGPLDEDQIDVLLGVAGDGRVPEQHSSAAR